MPATIVVGALAALAIHVPAAGAAVVLNEINCEATDWVELVNTSTTPADISGLAADGRSARREPAAARPPDVLSDPHDIPPGGKLVVEKVAGRVPVRHQLRRRHDPAGGRHAERPWTSSWCRRFAAAGDTWGRFPDGTGSWVRDGPDQGRDQRTFVRRRRPAARSRRGSSTRRRSWTSTSRCRSPPSTRWTPAPTEYQDARSPSRRPVGPTARSPLACGSRAELGRSARWPAKAAFKLKFNHSVAGQRFLGPQEADPQQHGPGRLDGPRDAGVRGVPVGRRARAAHRLRVRARERRGLRRLPGRRDARRRGAAELVRHDPAPLRGRVHRRRAAGRRRRVRGRRGQRHRPERPRGADRGRERAGRRLVGRDGGRSPTSPR